MISAKNEIFPLVMSQVHSAPVGRLWFNFTNAIGRQKRGVQTENRVIKKQRFWSTRKDIYEILPQGTSNHGRQHVR